MVFVDAGIYSYHLFSIINRMSQVRPVIWVNDPTDRRIIHIRQLFLRGLEEQSRTMINYYDFLLVAKKLNFRFEESSHLMELRKYFFAHKNMLNNKKLAGLLCVDDETLKEVRNDFVPSKIIIRLSVEGRIEAIKEATNEDEEAFDSEVEQDVEKYARETKNPINIDGEDKPEGQEYQQKLTIILSIKVTEMLKKIKLLLQGVPMGEDDDTLNLITVFNTIALERIPYELFRKGVLSLIKKLQNDLIRSRLTMSEDDIRAIFSILDDNSVGQITQNCIANLFDESATARKITRFYETRINRKMVKNTLFKLGKNNHSIQIYQVKNASVMEFKNIEEGLLARNRSREKLNKSRIPHFGPIKGANLRQSPSKHLLSRQLQRHNHTSLTTYKRPQPNLDRQREKIEHIIRSSKEEKKKSGNDTIANKLRKLFIHKVILPRERLIEQQKMKYVQNKTVSSQMIVKFM